LVRNWGVWARFLEAYTRIPSNFVRGVTIILAVEKNPGKCVGGGGVEKNLLDVVGRRLGGDRKRLEKSCA
jgi:hypothetical protein